MNCKPGDLAVIVKSIAGNEGKIVRCLVLHPPGHGNIFDGLGPVWETDNNNININFTHMGLIINGSSLVVDSQLRPIRPDETPEESADAMKKLHHIPNKETA